GFPSSSLTLLFGGVDRMQRRFITAIRIRGIIKNRKNFKIFFLGDGIVFMCMALCTGHRGSHPYRQRGVDAIDDRRVAELFVVRSAFVVGECVAMKRSGNQLLVR